MQERAVGRQPSVFSVAELYFVTVQYIDSWYVRDHRRINCISASSSVVIVVVYAARGFLHVATACCARPTAIHRLVFFSVTIERRAIVHCYRRCCTIVLVMPAEPLCFGGEELRFKWNCVRCSMKKKYVNYFVNTMTILKSYLLHFCYSR